MGRVGDQWVEHMFAGVLLFGFTCWAPNILGDTPDSLYNLAHEQLAIQSFRTCAVGGGYLNFSVNLEQVNDYPLMQLLYNDFVWKLMKGRAMLELRNPGSVLRQRVAAQEKRELETARKKVS